MALKSPYFLNGYKNSYNDNSNYEMLESWIHKINTNLYSPEQNQFLLNLGKCFIIQQTVKAPVMPKGQVAPFLNESYLRNLGISK